MFRKETRQATDKDKKFFQSQMKLFNATISSNPNFWIGGSVALRQKSKEFMNEDWNHRDIDVYYDRESTYPSDRPPRTTAREWEAYIHLSIKKWERESKEVCSSLGGVLGKMTDTQEVNGYHLGGKILKCSNSKMKMPINFMYPDYDGKSSWISQALLPAVFFYRPKPDGSKEWLTGNDTFGPVEILNKGELAVKTRKVHNTYDNHPTWAHKWKYWKRGFTFLNK